MPMINCPRCNKEISEQASNCPKCGLPIINCSECGANISDQAIHCSECGYPITKLEQKPVETDPLQKNQSKIHWGILLAMLALPIVLSLVDVPEKELTSDFNLPPEQVDFIKIIEKYAVDFDKASNEIKEQYIVKERNIEIHKWLEQRDSRVDSWVGTITSFGTNLADSPAIEIEISPNITLRSSLLLSQWTTAPMKDLLEVSRGQLVKFSGGFFNPINPQNVRSWTDALHFHETSMTTYGSMTDPEFLFSFTSLKPIN